MGLFINRQERPKLITSFMKRRNSERAWSRNRTTMLFATRRWHRSLEGRKAHRMIGRFLATRGKENILSSGLFIKRPK